VSQSRTAGGWQAGREKGRTLARSAFEVDLALLDERRQSRRQLLGDEPDALTAHVAHLDGVLVSDVVRVLRAARRPSDAARGLRAVGEKRERGTHSTQLDLHALLDCERCKREQVSYRCRAERGEGERDGRVAMPRAYLSPTMLALGMDASRAVSSGSSSPAVGLSESSSSLPGSTAPPPSGARALPLMSGLLERVRVGCEGVVRVS